MNSADFAYLSSVDPLDKRAWSGTHFSIYSTIESQVGSITALGPYQPLLSNWLGKIRTGLSQKITGKRFDYRHSQLVSNSFALYFEKKLKQNKFDYIVAPAASCELAYLNTTLPIVYISDTTFKRSLGYHKALTGLSNKSIREADEIERKALEKSHKIIVSSHWAAESVIKDYAIDEKRVFVIPFGPNMAQIPERTHLKRKFNENKVQLLFPAVYWDNKGGDYAVNCLIELQKLNIEASLTVVGCVPPEKARSIRGLQFVPYLNKNNPSDLIKMQELFLQADFLILPTRFDCTPIVFCEASAFGLPSLCSDTGGVRGHITEGINGYLFDYYDNGEGYAKKIIEILRKPEEYAELRKSSRNYYEEKLNWHNWASEFKKIISS